MKNRKSALMIAVALIVFLLTGTSYADTEGLGFRLGIGTDVTGGLAFGVGVNRLIGGNMEVGAVFFSAHVEESSEEYGNTYDETTDVTVLAAMVNILHNYSPDDRGIYYITGVGIGMFSVEWEESSPTDTSLGTPLPGGGSMMSEDGTAGGTIFNLGVGMNLQDNLDIRAEAPMFLMFSAPGESSAFVPTFTLTMGYRF